MKLDYERPLMAYAYLAQSGAQNDILGGLIPVIAPIAKEHAGQIVDVDHLRNELGRLYGIDVHPWAMDELIPRLIKAKLIIETPVGRGRSLHHYAVREDANSDGTTEDDIQFILDDVVAFAAGIMKQSGISLPQDFIQKHFMNQLVTADFQVRLIRPEPRQHQDAKILTLKTSDAGQPEDPELSAEAKSLNQVKIICAAYILHAYHNNPNIYRKLLNIASGAIIAEYVLNLREPGENVALNGLRLYLDGPLAMSYLDLSEEASSKHVCILLDKLKEKGAQLCIFRDHVDEIHDNLRAAQVAHNSDSNGPPRATHRRLQTSASFRSYVQSVLADIDGSLARKAVTVVRYPEQSINYFNDSLITTLTSDLGNYNAQARHRDARAIGGIHRLRSGRITSQSYFYDCRHIFVTDNKKVAAVAFDFAIRNCDYRKSYVPPVITDRYLAGLMLVMYGGSAASELSHERLLANCASALEPNHELLMRVTGFLSDVDVTRANAFVEMMTSSRTSQHRAVFLLDDRTVIRDLADAERAFVAFEAEIEESIRSIYEAQQQEEKKAYELKLAAIHEAKEKITQEADTTGRQYEERIGELEDTLSKSRSDYESLMHTLDSQNQKRIESDKNDLEDLLGQATRAVQDKRKLTVFIIGAVGFALAALVNYWSFSLAGDIQKVICAIALVAVPGLSTLVTSRVLKKNDERNVKNKFQALLKQRKNLEKASYDFRIDYRHGKAEWSGNEGSDSLKLIE
ncbi:hypothetical protein [Stutzerimonas nitrititolerans]|uniref:hypothetical protein n=1 Tax=Stutzerimonas nitrititolerans TaxID=2482751 RepID=UPI002896565C|nr:hypothetical protein [Stutzerimonas nitrititolerans]